MGQLVDPHSLLLRGNERDGENDCFVKMQGKNAADRKNKYKYVLWQTNIYVLLTMHLSIILDNDQLNIRFLYFTIRLL